ncbi:MAG: glycosyltransferase [Chloroflexota bacterium]|nr:glycosyltransferase [Chloroflexota bacterium]MBI5702012.1 glycosyltransferase [Chloroflexota bacterium]
MKIAYVVPYVPNLIRTRPYNLILQLAALGHDVTVFTLGSGAQDQKDAEALRSRGVRVVYDEQPLWRSLWNSLMTVPSRRPLQTVYSWNPRLAEELVKQLSVAGAFDLLHVEHLRGSRYGQYVKSKLPHVPVVWDSVDCISYLFEQAAKHGTGGAFGRFVTRFELGRTRRMEGRLIGEFDHVLVTSETDRKALLELAPAGSQPSPVSVLPNGVDLDFFRPNPEVQRDADTLVFSGKMSYHANVSMVKYLVAEIMPRVWRERSEVRLVIVGKDPTPEVRALGADSRITVTGTVADIRPYLWQAAVAVVPLVYGAGIQNKILEAMACGTPVVTTSRTLSALDVTPGRELLAADGAEAFANAALALLEDRGRREAVGAAGAEYVRKRHSWRSITERMVEHYVEACRQAKVLH